MANLKTTRTKVKSLSDQVEEFVIDKMGLPRFSLPYIGPKYVRNTTRRIMVVCAYRGGVERTAFNNAKYAVYGNFFYKNADNLIKNSKECRVNPYLLDNLTFDMSGLLENIDKNMTVKDVVVHRFVPYPKIEGVENVPDEVYKKAVEMFVGLVDICHPTHIFFTDENIDYAVNGDFKRFRGESFYDFCKNLYITPICGGEDLKWDYYISYLGSPAEIVPGFASDAMSFLDVAKGVLDDPRLIPALSWDDEKIEYYGVDKNLFSEFKRNPEYVKKMLLSEELPRNIFLGLLLPFENLKYSKILYANPDCVFDVYGDNEKNSDDWKEACEMIALHNETLKNCSDAFKKKRNALGSVKIRSLSSYLKIALKNLAEKLHIKYESRTLAELRGLIEELYSEAYKLSAVRKPISLVHITEKQRLARSMNAGRRKMVKPKGKTDSLKENDGVQPIIYNRKRISQKQRDHLARIRLKRRPKSEKASDAV